MNLDAKIIEAAAQAYYEVRPLHYVLKNGISEPVPWATMLKSDKCSVRAASLKRHREAIRAALLCTKAHGGEQ